MCAGAEDAGVYIEKVALLVGLLVALVLVAEKHVVVVFVHF